MVLDVVLLLGATCARISNGVTRMDFTSFFSANFFNTILIAAFLMLLGAFM